MSDYLVRATAANGQIRAFAARTTDTVEEARQRHNCSPVVSAGLGRLMSAALMMGSMMKGEKDVLTLKVEGSGPAGMYLATANSHGNVKGYAANPGVVLPANSAGKLDVAGSIGVGLLTVTRDIGLKEPYSGTCELISGEIAEDITYYFASSEQTPSSVGLGVLMTKENTVDAAGGFIIQVMPDATEETISGIEEKLATVSSVTSLMAEGKTPEDILGIILGDVGLEILDRMPVGFKCDCSREKVKDALALVSREEMAQIIADNKPIEVVCHFCNTSYNFDVQELKMID